MNIRTLLLYAAMACGGVGAGAVILPHLTSHSDVPQALQESGETGNIQRKGPPPSLSPSKGF